MSDLLTEDQVRSAATEINFLRLPIFKTTRAKVSTVTVSLDYSVEGGKN